MKKSMRIKLGIAVCMMAAMLSGCGNNKYEEVVATTAVVEATAAAEPSKQVVVLETETKTAETTASVEIQEERVEIDGKISSYLTGELVDVEKANRRPLAIMMSNDKEAQPHYGINRAGVVYEAPVEGTMNRFMAIIEDYDDLERIGSVRSCRTYYTYFAREFDAIYAHFGQSTFAVPYLENVDNINGVEGVGGNAFFRSNDKKAPHNAYASASKIKKTIEKLGYSTEYSDSYQGHFKFAGGTTQVQLDGQDAYKVVPGYSYNEPWFEYNEEDGLYYRYQYGAAHKGNEGQIAVKNIIIQYAEWGYYATTDYLNINLHTGREGYYITNGKAIPVTWKKDGEFGVTRYYDLEGNEIILNKGKTWICVNGTDKVHRTEFYGK
ncbi:MAG: DUF3048 domain-containing protein [Lachnospiraceae bacterium]|nr:DUF3048 domain-containing protein [Lachnospiraceae bacterium]